MDSTNNKVSIEFTCPDCNCKFGQSTDLLFYGKYTFSKCLCECCENTYLHTLPIAFEADYPVSYSLVTKKAKYNTSIKQHAQLAVDLNHPKSVSATITKKIYLKKSGAILLNCLDTEVGTVFIKLLNASYILGENADKGLIVLIPKSFENLVPKGISELWLVDSALESLQFQIDPLDSFIKAEKIRFANFDIYPTSLNPKIDRNKLVDYLNVAPFNIEAFSNSSFQLIFLLNKDKLWIKSAFDSFLLSNPLLRRLNSYFKWKQKRLVKRLFYHIHKNVNQSIRLYAVEIGHKDLKPTGAMEYKNGTLTIVPLIDSYALYAQSHIVMGVEGSTLVIPSLLAANTITLFNKEETNDIDFNLSTQIKKINRYSTLTSLAQNVIDTLNRK